MTNEQTLEELLGMNFTDQGWTARDTGNSKMFRKLNHKERRIQKAQQRKAQKRLNTQSRLKEYMEKNNG